MTREERRSNAGRRHFAAGSATSEVTGGARGSSDVRGSQRVCGGNWHVHVRTARCDFVIEHGQHTQDGMQTSRLVRATCCGVSPAYPPGVGGLRCGAFRFTFAKKGISQQDLSFTVT